MAPISKENEVLTAAPVTSTAIPAATGARHEDTASRPQPVALEVPVTVNGARTVEGSDKREPFSETTKTVLVFGNGAVIRLGSPVSPGQLLFLTNEKTKKEVVCQVVKSKNYRNISGYVELEFTESVVGFWGMRFPSDRIGVQAPVAATTVPPAPKLTPSGPLSVSPKPVNPVVSAAPKIPEVKPAQIHAEASPAPQARPVELKAVAPTASKPEAPPIQSSAAPVTPIVKKPEVPVVPAFPISASLASSVASLLNAPDVQPVWPASKPSTPAVSLGNKLEPAGVAADNSSEELKLQAARLQEQLSSMLFSPAPATKPVPPAPAAPALDPKTISGVTTKVLELAKSEPAPIKSVPPAKTSPTPIKSSLDTEEVKIPSWLEPLARNAAAPASTQELLEREKAKHAAEIAVHEEHPSESLPVAEVESAPEIQLPGIGSLLPLDESVSTHDRPSRGSGRGVLIGTIAAAILLAAGGAWYLLHPTNAVQGTTAPVASAATPQTNAAAPGLPATQPALQNTVAAPQATSGSSAATPAFGTPASSAPLSKPPANPEPVPPTRDNTRGSSTTIPAAATERISRPVPEPKPEPEPKKPVLGEVHLASPTMNRPANGQDDGAAPPTLPTGNADTNDAGLNSGLPAGNVNQPAAPDVPPPVGGDVKPAKLISSVSPQYPMLAKNQHVSGNVIIDALIDANGHVTTMKVISGPQLLHQAAMDALKQWRYQPASLDGKPVAMHLTVTMQFRP